MRGLIDSGRQKWLPLFLKFINQLRIDSKEIQASDARGTKLSLWGSQVMALEQLCSGLDEEVRDFRFLKGRQEGCTTLFAAIDIFWHAMFDGMIGAFVAESDDNRKKFRRMIQRYMKSFPATYFGKHFRIVDDNASFMSWTNGSRLDFLMAGTGKNPNWGEGKGYAFCHCSEIGSYGDADGIRSFREALAETHPNRLFIYEGTAKGYNHWYNMLEEAEENPFTMRRCFIPWFSKELNRIKESDPRYSVFGIVPPSGRETELIHAAREQTGHLVTMEQLAWYRERWQQAETTGTLLMLQQNQPWIPSEAFITTGYSFFQVRRVQARIGEILEAKIQWLGYKYYLGSDFFSIILEPIRDQARIADVELRIWEDPHPNGTYVIGCDPAYGRSEDADRTAISVWRCYADKLVQVAEFASPLVETHQCTWVLAHLAGAYKNCLVNIELGGPGRAVLQEFDSLKMRLKAEMYAPQVKDRDWEDALAYARDYLYHKPDHPGSGGFVRHFETNWRSKRELMNQIRDSFSTQQLVCNSIPLLDEMTKMTQEKDDIAPSATGGSHDDRVFAAALANRAWLTGEGTAGIRDVLIQQGMTYQRVHSEETGQMKASTQFVDRLVHNFFLKAQEAAENADTPASWLEERGLA